MDVFQIALRRSMQLNAKSRDKMERSEIDASSGASPSVSLQPSAMRKSLSFLSCLFLLTAVSGLNPSKYKVFLEARVETGGGDGDNTTRGAFLLSGVVETDAESRGSYNVPILKKNFHLKSIEATQNGDDVTRAKRPRPNNRVYHLMLTTRSGTFKLKIGFERLGQDLPEIGYRPYKARGPNATEAARSLAIVGFGSEEERFPFPIVEGINMSQPVDINIHIKLMRNITLLVDKSNVDVVHSPEESGGDQHTTEVLSLRRRSSLSELFVVLLGPSFSSLASSKPTSVRLWGQRKASASLYFLASRQELLGAALSRLFGDVVSTSRAVDLVAAPVVRIHSGPGPSTTLVLVPDSTLMVDAATSGPSTAMDALLAMTRCTLISLLPVPATSREDDAFVLFAQYAVGHLVDRSHRLEEFFVVDVTRNSLDKDVDFYATNPCLGKEQKPWKSTSARGAALLRMLSSRVSEEKFWGNIRKLIQAISNSPPNTRIDSTLLNSMLGKSSEWVSRRGYPLITVTRNYSAGTAQVKQSSFLGEDNSPRTVPLEYTSSIASSKLGKFLLKNVPGPQTLEDLGRGSFHYIMLNPRGNGYYRVQYDAKNWVLLRSQLSEATTRGLLSPVARSVLVDDALSLARARLLSYNDALELASYLRDEDDALPWKAAIRQLSFLNAALSQAPVTAMNMFRRFLEELVSRPLNALKEVEENGEELTEAQKLLKNTLLPWTCELGLPSCNDVIYMEKDPSARLAWLCNEVRDKTSEAIWQDFLGAETSDRKLYVEALKCASNADVIQRFVSEAVEGGIEFNPENIVSAVVNNPNTPRAVTRVVTRAHRTAPWLPVVVQDIYHSVSKNSDFAIIRSNLDLCREGSSKIWESSNERVSWSRKFLGDVTQWLEMRYAEKKPTS